MGSRIDLGENAQGAALTLDLSYVTKAAAIVAQRRKGKTYTASVIAEELIDADVPFVVIDPTGAWWGLRASADGGEGYAVTILGGQHGDVPIDRQAGTAVADLVLDHPGWFVCDLSLFESHEAERSFVRAFLDRLYRRKGQPGMGFPLHVFIDEADVYAPQQPQPGDQQMLGAFKTLVKRGGLRGLGATVITQRPASLSKHVLEQVDILIVLRVVGPNDRRAIDDYVKDNASPELRHELMGSLANLALGQGWVWEPGAEPPTCELIQVRKRYTFNSSATPELGQEAAQPKRLAAVDLEAVKELLAEAVERADAEDAEKLRRKLRVAEAQIEKLERGVVAPTAPEPVFVIPSEFVEEYDRTTEHLSKAHELLASLDKSLEAAWAALAKRETAPPREVREKKVDGAAGVVAPLGYTPQPQGTLDIDDGEEAILDTLAWFESVKVEEVNRTQLALFVGASPKSSGYGKRIARLLGEGLVCYPGPGLVALSEAGRVIATPTSSITTSEEMHAALYERLPEGQGRILRVLIAARGAALHRETIADRVGMSPNSSGFGRYISQLATLGYAHYPDKGFVAATDVLWLEDEKRSTR